MDDDERTRELHARGLTVLEIAAELGKSKWWVYRALTRLALPTPQRTRAKEEGYSEMIRFRVTKVQLRALLEAAGEQDLSEYLRTRLFGSS